MSALAGRHVARCGMTFTEVGFGGAAIGNLAVATTERDAADARKTVAPARSLGVPHRRAGIRSTMDRARSGSSRRACVLSVAM